MATRLVAIAFGVAMLMSAATDPRETIAASEIARLEMGTATWPEIERRWGPGRLVGRSAPYCGAIRSVHAIAGERWLELSWRRGVVCDWRIGPEEIVGTGSADRIVGAAEDA